MKAVASIPLSSISRLAIVVTNCRKTLAQVKAETGADYLLNGGMWNADGSPCRGLKVDGKLLSATPWGDLAGYGWNTPQDLTQTTAWQEFDNYIATSPLIVAGKRLEKLPYDSAQGGARPRSAMGIVGSSLLLYCTNSSMTPEQLCDELEDRGCSSAMMLDSGGSTQCDFNGQIIQAERKVDNWICVWVKGEADQTPPESEESVGKYRVTPSIGLNIRSGPGTSYGKAGAYSCGTVVDILSIQEFWGQTDKGWVSMTYLEPVEAVQRVTDNGIAIQVDYIPKGRKTGLAGSIRPAELPSMRLATMPRARMLLLMPPGSRATTRRIGASATTTPWTITPLSSTCRIPRQLITPVMALPAPETPLRSASRSVSTRMATLSGPRQTRPLWCAC